MYLLRKDQAQLALQVAVARVLRVARLLFLYDGILRVCHLVRLTLAPVLDGGGENRGSFGDQLEGSWRLWQLRLVAALLLRLLLEVQLAPRRLWVGGAKIDSAPVLFFTRLPESTLARTCLGRDSCALGRNFSSTRVFTLSASFRCNLEAMDTDTSPSLARLLRALQGRAGPPLWWAA